MATSTSKLGLTLPEATDNFSLSLMNQNSQKIDAFAKTLSVDYIVGQGTSGIWTWRKWSSGIAECWGRREITVAVNIQWDASQGDYISATLTGETFPFTFKQVPCCFMTCETTTGDIANVMTDGYGASVSRAPNYRLFRGASISSKKYRINYDVKGRWK